MLLLVRVLVCPDNLNRNKTSILVQKSIRLDGIIKFTPSYSKKSDFSSDSSFLAGGKDNR